MEEKVEMTRKDWGHLMQGKMDLQKEVIALQEKVWNLQREREADRQKLASASAKDHSYLKEAESIYHWLANEGEDLTRQERDIIVLLGIISRRLSNFVGYSWPELP